MKEIEVENEIEAYENKTIQLTKKVKNASTKDQRNQEHPEMYVDRKFCQKSMSYEIEDYWQIWPEETIKFNSENPENATLGKASNSEISIYLDLFFTEFKIIFLF